MKYFVYILAQSSHTIRVIFCELYSTIFIIPGCVVATSVRRVV